MQVPTFDEWLALQLLDRPDLASSVLDLQDAFDAGWRAGAVTVAEEVQRVLTEAKLTAGRMGELLGEQRQLEHGLPLFGLEEVSGG